MTLLRKFLRIVRPEYNRQLARQGIWLHRTSRLFNPDQATIGRHVYFGPGCRINAQGGLTIGDGAIFAPEVVVLTSTHDYKSGNTLPYDVFDVHRPVEIGPAAWLGYRAMICPGVKIGQGAVIAMGAVVTDDVEAGQIVGGNPARVLSKRDAGTFEGQIEEDRLFIKRFWNGQRPRKVSERSG